MESLALSPPTERQTLKAVMQQLSAGWGGRGSRAATGGGATQTRLEGSEWQEQQRGRTAIKYIIL